MLTLIRRWKSLPGLGRKCKGTSSSPRAPGRCVCVLCALSVGTPRRTAPTFRRRTHTSDDSYIYQLSLVVATATTVVSSLSSTHCHATYQASEQLLYTVKVTLFTQRLSYCRWETIPTQRRESSRTRRWPKKGAALRYKTRTQQ